jgi:hypothetical protein
MAQAQKPIHAMQLVLIWFYSHLIRPERPIFPASFTQFDEWPERMWRNHFRFFSVDVDRVIQALQIPPIVMTARGYVTTGRNAFLILCKRLR